MSPARLLKTIDRAHIRATDDVAEINRLWFDFGAAVRNERRANNIGLASFSKALGVSKAYVGFLETGKRRWDFDMAKRAVKLITK